jgi:phosphate transport system substrate-binding protein
MILKKMTMQKHVWGSKNLRHLYSPCTRLAAWCLCAIAVCLATPAVAEVLNIEGSGNAEYVLGELARAFNGSQNQHQVLVPPTIGTAGGLRQVAQNKTSMGRVGRPLTEAESKLGITYHALGRDPVTFVGGAGVTISNITRAQAVDIFTGKLANWREVGGKPASIRVIGREATDASMVAIAREIKAFDHLHFGDHAKVVNLDSQMIELLDHYPASIGFLNRSALSGANSKLVFLALDNVASTTANMNSGRYPLWLEFGLIYKKSELTPAGREFLQFVDSPEGARLLQLHGVLPHPLPR